MIELEKPVVVHYQLSVAELIEKAVERGEARLSSTGALCAWTGAFTGRSPKDKYIVEEPAASRSVQWGTVNQPLSPERFDKLHRRAVAYMREREMFVFDGYVGADKSYRLPIRVMNEFAWHNLFAFQLFIRPTKEQLPEHNPSFTIISLPGFKADPAVDGTRSDTFIAISFERRIVLIGGTEYAGEMKKSAFTVLNYLLPQQGVLPMHCSANTSEDSGTALFFGLSGTGKTTLSADPDRQLIGDDEHGWTDEGIFNFEGGCYAKCIGLTEEREPQIWRAIRFGAVLENVVLQESTGLADYSDSRLTENTRAAYPIEHIDNALLSGVAGHPRTILFLTADAFGVLPPIAKLTKEQAMYHFLSGYTSKLAGTERGVTAPEATFSACFGEPFLPLAPSVYADMLGERIERNGVHVYLVNTGWTGGPYGEGERIKLTYTRAMVAQAIEGGLAEADYVVDPVFGLYVPQHVKGVPDELLQPRAAWPNPEAYDRQAKELAELFAANFRRFPEAGESVAAAGPEL
ncbi:phosphoenolpyruvate carboxykinase (ATP) [Paenibacillus sp. NPDC058071]|uniref:phosphoenolpyruvate carboxykinase (ATP) n=1 Tax=Paenibacillus sp. NPDC058071 TaxID=3346326 RepID=UPI0036DD2A0B